jgi:hypothetical protein
MIERIKRWWCYNVHRGMNWAGGLEYECTSCFRRYRHPAAS